VRSNVMLSCAFDRTMCVRPQKTIAAQLESDGHLGHAREMRADGDCDRPCPCARPSVRSNAPSVVERTWQGSNSSLSVFLLSCGQLLL
jgi:hypothetical protein